MTHFVLMNKRTGDLMLGVRVTFFENDLGDIRSYQYKSDSSDSVYYIAFGPTGYIGWLIEHPKMGKFNIFFNKKCEEWFEVLGEL